MPSPLTTTLIWLGFVLLAVSHAAGAIVASLGALFELGLFVYNGSR